MNGTTALGATNMNHLETGVSNATTTADGAVPKSTVTTAGDIIYATGSAAVTRLALGATGTVLKGGSSAPSWASIVNADVSSSAAIAASKLKLSDLAQSQSTPSSPTGTTSLTMVMMGLAGSITPAVTGRVHITVNGYLLNNTATQVTSVDLMTGTGTAPTNGAASTGSQQGNGTGAYAVANNARSPFSLTAIVTGLTLSTAVWIDLACSVTGGTGSPANITIVAFEF